MLTSLDLFSGIAGFALGFHRAGIGTSAFCEIEPYPRQILAERFPSVPLYDDVRTLTLERLLEDGVGRPSVLCGGFPCQDISTAGRGAGLSGERSGLWWEYHRLISEIRPEWVVAENSPALRGRGLGDILRSLDALGYDAVWNCVPASHVGAPHRRDRVWLVAHATRVGRPQGRGIADPEVLPKGGRGTGDPVRGCSSLANPHGSRLEVFQQRLEAELEAVKRTSPWPAEPDVGRVAYGVSRRVDRIKALGNAVVPKIPELIGRAIVHAHNS
jgi:DNA (cytosine-5)-methyltransferase 1